MQGQSETEKHSIELIMNLVIVSLQKEKLLVLLAELADPQVEEHWCLPGSLISHNESLEQAATRLLQTLTGVRETYIEQLVRMAEHYEYEAAKQDAATQLAGVLGCPIGEARWRNSDHPRLYIPGSNVHGHLEVRSPESVTIEAHCIPIETALQLAALLKEAV